MNYKKTKNKSPKIKALNSICACVLLFAIIYILIAGVNAAALSAIAVSVVGVASPVVLTGEGLLEIFIGIIEAILQGFMVIIEGIAEVLSGFFG